MHSHLPASALFWAFWDTGHAALGQAAGGGRQAGAARAGAAGEAVSLAVVRRHRSAGLRGRSHRSRRAVTSAVR